MSVQLAFNYSPRCTTHTFWIHYFFRLIFAPAHQKATSCYRNKLGEIPNTLKADPVKADCRRCVFDVTYDSFDTRPPLWRAASSRHAELSRFYWTTPDPRCELFLPSFLLLPFLKLLSSVFSSSEQISALRWELLSSGWFFSLVTPLKVPSTEKLI